MAKRGTPELFRMYKLCLLLYRIFNERILDNDWLSLNFNQANTNRQTKFNVRKNNQLMVGMNILNNRFYELDNIIPLTGLTRQLTISKYHVKTCF